MRRKNLITVIACAAATSMLANAPQARAVANAYTWNSLTGGTYNWGDASNWNPNTGVPGVGDSANLSVNETGNLLVNLGTGQTVGLLTLGTTSATPLTTDIGNGSGVLTMDNTGGANNSDSNPANANPTIISGGTAGDTNIISAVLKLTGSPTATTPNVAVQIANASTNSLSLSGGILIDNDNSANPTIGVTRQILNDLPGGTVLNVGPITSGFSVVPQGTPVAPSTTISLTNILQFGNRNDIPFSSAALSTVNLTGTISNGTAAIVGGTTFNSLTKIMYGQASSNPSAGQYSLQTFNIAGNNTYTGGTTVLRANVVLQSDTAFGTGTVTVGGVASYGYNIASDNDARTIANAVSMSRNTTINGSHSLTLNGSLTQGNTSIFTNLLPAGKTVTFAGTVPSNSTTPAYAIGTDNSTAGGRLFSFDGPGTTIVSGKVTNGILVYADAPTNTIPADNGTTGQIAKNGDGLLIFSNTANTYSRFSAANGGTFEFTNQGAIGQSNSAVANAGGAIGVDTGTLASTLPALLAAAAQPSTGSLALSAADASTSISFVASPLNNANTVGMSIGALPSGVNYTGTITPDPTQGYRLGGGGTLTLGTANALTGTHNLTATNGGTVALTSSNNFSGSITVQASYIVTQEQAAAANNNNSAIVVTSPYINPFFVPPGVLESTTLAVSSIDDGASGSLGGSSNALTLKGGTLKITGSGGTTARSITLSPLGGTLDSSGNSPVTFNNVGPIINSDSPSGTITGIVGKIDSITGVTDISNLAIGMAVTGSGIQNNSVITGIQPNFNTSGNAPSASTYTIYISNNGTNQTALPATPLSFFNQNRTLTLAGTNVSDNTISSSLVDSPTGSLGIAKSGSGTWLLSNAANTFSGPITITGGALKSANATALGYGGLTRTNQPVGAATVSGGTLDLNGQTINKPVVLSGGTLGNSSASAAALGSGVAGVAVTASGSTVPNTATLVFTGANTTPAAGNLSFGISVGASGTFVSPSAALPGTLGYVVNDILNVVGGGGTGGQLRVTSVDGSGAITGINVANAGFGYTLVPTGVSDLTTPAANANAAVFTTNNAFTIAGVTMTSPGTGYASAPTVTLSNASSLTATVAMPTVTLAASTTSSIGGSNGDIAVPEAVLGNGNFTKVGSNTVTLGSANNYTGNTVVSAGALKVGTGSSLGIGGLMPLGQTVGTTSVTSGTLDLNGQTVTEPITLNGGTLGNSSATAASITSGVAGISLASSGTNLPSNASLNISGGGGATASLNLALTPATLTLANGGSGAKLGDTLSITGGGGSGATIKVLGLDSSNTVITTYVLTSPGSGYTSLPTGVTDLTTTAATGISFTFNENTLTALGVMLTNSGAGYTSTPTVTPSGGTLAATAALSSINLASQSGIGGSNGDISIPLNITGASGFNKVGTDTVTLSAANSYGGPTNVNQGTLAVTTTGSIPGAVTVGTTGAGATVGNLNFAPSTSGILVRNLTSLNVANGVATVQAAATATQNTIRSVLVTPSLTIGAAGKVDLANNDLVVKNTAPSSVLTQLAAGFNAHVGYWNGNGIVSSSAAGDTRFLTTLGYRQASNGTFDTVSTTTADTIVKYTYYGDANLDGLVNGADYQQIDNGFGTSATGWQNGDFNYDGVINGSDFALIDNTFNQITATGATALAIIASPASVIATPAVSAVPEPTTLGLLGIGAASLLGRRRRRTV